MNPQNVFSQSNLPFLLALLRIPGLGSRTILQLCDYAGSPELVFKISTSELESIGLNQEATRAIQKPPWHRVEQDLNWQEKTSEHHLITPANDAYPVLLREIIDLPPVLYVKGELACLQSLQLGVVGTRKPTADGKRLARGFSAELSRYGIVVTSGLAMGIDSAAHEGALQAGGKTVAVMGHGLSEIYPRRNANLAARICESGALISEFPMEYRPKAHNFPKRNRIISGMSAGTLVVEAALRSGSLITAHCAAEQGREVFAIPGAIHNPMVRGCHLLIREGAKLVQQVMDIVEEIGPVATVAGEDKFKLTSRQPLIKGLDVSAKLLLDNIGNLPVHINQLVETTGLPADAIAVNLTKLELQGLIECMPGANYVRKPFET